MYPPRSCGLKARSVLILLYLACLTVYPVRQVAVMAQGLPPAEQQPEDVPGGSHYCYDVCNSWWYLAKHENLASLPAVPKRPILIAVIDDGFLLSHQDIAPFIYKNPLEKPNGRDDDGNGYIDDISGWDISDGDNDVAFPPGRRDEYFHGTYIAGIIAKTLTSVYGDKASEYFKIVPIKALSDFAGYLYIKDGYKALDYAAKVKPDIICMAWGSNVDKPEDKVAINGMLAKGSILLASAGNFGNSKEQYPAAYDGVIAVAAVDSNDQKVDISTSGSFVDVSAPGLAVCGGSIYGDDQYLSCSGTSPAVAIATAMAAIVKLNKPEADAAYIDHILKSTSTPIEQYNPGYAGRLGAGVVDMNNLVKWLNGDNSFLEQTDLLHPEGQIQLDGAAKDVMTWNIQPAGNYYSIEFDLDSVPDNVKNATIGFSGASGQDTTIRIADWIANGPYSVQGSQATVRFDPGTASKKFKATINYEVVPIDSTVLYCSGTSYYFDETGEIEDGSGDANYTNLSGCKWLIKVPEGKNIVIKFTELDTELGVDNIMIFASETAMPEYMLARISGHTVPPAFNTHSNQVLIFFVTDGKNTGKGWKLEYTTQ